MVTLQILKSLCEECRRDLPLFAYSVLKAVGYALDVKLAPNAGPTTAGVDLEILARASSVVRRSVLSVRRGCSGLTVSFTASVPRFHDIHPPPAGHSGACCALPLRPPPFRQASHPCRRQGR